MGKASTNASLFVYLLVGQVLLSTFTHSMAVSMRALHSSSASAESQDDRQSVCMETPTVFLTVSSIAKSKKGELHDRIIEINWNYLEPQSGDWVGLFDHDPDENGTEPLNRVSVGNLPRGYIKSDYRLPRLSLTDREDSCLGFWIALIRDERVLLRNCLRIYPKWMKENRNIIGDMPLSSLIIPGTHNSGSWREYEGPASDTVFYRYLINQDEPVYRQLMHGIRYLDIRVGYYPKSEEKFWINHNFYRMRALSEIIADVKKFVEETGEIVILDFHRFPVGFEGQRSKHALLVEYIHSELGPHIVPNSLWPHGTPNDIWNVNKSVIIAYSDTQTAQQYPYLWPPLPQEWGDKRTLPELKEFLGDSLKKRGGKGRIWAAMAEFTPKPLDVVLRPTQGLRNMAQTVNIPMTYWFQDRTWNSRSNIIATDFFLGNNIIQTSINSNIKGFQCTP
ncbi:unnamed protein product [Allacma fusca]|uniref:Phosphatidylinositol-specific phospholipase C X domain-containing protein n=1 Tax=Allacma fusca TaxID=39272 RepID=A0A8J2MA71_9HEXA|nr:unnamed protein product [Allacma fusca]